MLGSRRPKRSKLGPLKTKIFTASRVAARFARGVLPFSIRFADEAGAFR
jgi:hypothetical protein